MNRISFGFAALVALFLIGLAFPAQAKIDKIMNRCEGPNGTMILCPTYHASFAQPKGWTTDKKSGASQGVEIFLPHGKTFRNAPAMIYGEARYNPQKTPLAQWIENSDRSWTENAKGMAVETLPAGDLGAGKREVIIHRYINPDKNQPVEIIGYFAETDADGNPFVVRLTLSGLSAEAVEAARPIFDATLKNYQ